MNDPKPYSPALGICMIPVRLIFLTCIYAPIYIVLMLLEILGKFMDETFGFLAQTWADFGLNSRFLLSGTERRSVVKILNENRVMTQELRLLRSEQDAKKFFTQPEQP